MFTRDGVTSTFSTTRSEGFPGAIEANLVMSSEAYALLEELSLLVKEDMGDVIVRGMMLLSVAAKAKREGKEIGIGREGQPLETVINVF